MCIRYFFAAVLVLFHLCSAGVNHVRKSYLDYEKDDAKLLFRVNGFSNEGNATIINFDIECSDMPFVVDSVQIEVCDTVYASLDRFMLKGYDRDVVNKRALYSIDAEFPKLVNFTDTDKIQVFSSEGVFDMPLTFAGSFNDEIDMLKEEQAKLIDEYESHIGMMRLWSIIVIVSVFIVGLCIWFWVKRIRRNCNARCNSLVEECNIMKEAMSECDLRLQDMFRGRFDTLNMICGEYFEKKDSVLTRATLVNDVEKIIMRYRSAKAIEELASGVNNNMNHILECISKQIPDLNDSDMLFITYLYAGFSSKSICLMMDLKIKNFYNRRTHLKDKILASEAVDKVWFASQM